MRVDKFNKIKFNHKKIIHVDMDCFYASVEIRDNPQYIDKPVAVAGSSENRGVVTTCNYLARRFGVKSAMPSVIAKRLCPDIIFLPINMHKYRDVSKEIHKIFKCYTKIVEPVSLDEAYLDVTDSEYCDGDPEKMALQIRQKISEDLGVTASAGISSNKFLAKIASDWNKPNGQFSVSDNDIDRFVLKIPVRSIHGVGEKTEIVLKSKKINTCEDLQKFKKYDLIDMLGKYGDTLYQLCRGIDEREVESNRIRKSLSVEDTYEEDLKDFEICSTELLILYEELLKRIDDGNYENKKIKSCFIKIKYNDFKLTSSQISCTNLNFNIFLKLLKQNNVNKNKPIRLLGLGVNFNNTDNNQLNLDIF
ncbi:MAG: DNA polymerase IV [Gammaproteobacteria bacterium]|tara:strand:+ start:1960 stop:3048 length:1089 start_codon:yes stop_codon:yes gene_type:complete